MVARDKSPEVSLSDCGQSRSYVLTDQPKTLPSLGRQVLVDQRSIRADSVRQNELFLTIRRFAAFLSLVLRCRVVFCPTDGVSHAFQYASATKIVSIARSLFDI